MKSLRAAIIVTIVAVAPALALAQQAAPKVELGADLTVQYLKPEGNDGIIHIGSMLMTGDVELMTIPVTFRLGLVSEGPTSFEARLAAGLTSITGSGGHTYYSIAPGLNVLRRLRGKAANDNTYVTAGASVNVFGYSGSLSSHTYGIISFNAGLGMRRPWGTGASRGEFFIAYTLENTSLGSPNYVNIGVHLGVSLFK